MRNEGDSQVTLGFGSAPPFTGFEATTDGETVYLVPAGSRTPGPPSPTAFPETLEYLTLAPGERVRRTYELLCPSTDGRSIPDGRYVFADSVVLSGAGRPEVDTRVTVVVDGDLSVFASVGSL